MSAIRRLLGADAETMSNTRSNFAREIAQPRFATLRDPIAQLCRDVSPSVDEVAAGVAMQ